MRKNFSHSIRYLFKINIDKVKEKRDIEISSKNGTNLDLDYILNYYFSNFKSKCKFSKNPRMKDNKILPNSKILIYILIEKIKIIILKGIFILILI